MTVSTIPVSVCNPKPVIHLFPGLRTAIGRALKTVFQVAKVAHFAWSSAKAVGFLLLSGRKLLAGQRGIESRQNICFFFAKLLLHNFHSDTTTNYLSTSTKKATSIH